MSLFKTLILSNQTKVLLRTQNPPYRGLLPPSSFIIRSFSSSLKKPTKKPLSLLFQEAVDLFEETGGNESRSGIEGEKNNELIRELRELEGEFRMLKESPNPKGKMKEKEGVERERPKKDKSSEIEFRKLKESPETKGKMKERVGGETEKPKKVQSLEIECRKLKESPKPKGKMKEKEGGERERPKKVKSLVELFSPAKKEKKLEEVEKVLKVRSQGEEMGALKDLSQIAESFLRHLYAKGYFNKANFLKGNGLNFVNFDDSYSRDFIKFAASKFGKDHQEVAKWLSGSHLKKVVLFGCPSLDKNNVFAAKRMRKFMKIEESTVCRQCMLKDLCKFANQNVHGNSTKNLLLVDVMKVITLYVLDQVPATLTVPEEVKDSATQLLMEAIKLSKST